MTSDARKLWLARRREILPDGMVRVQASDVPAILAYHDDVLAEEVYGGRGAWHHVFAAKCGADEGEDTPAKWWGRQDEMGIALRYTMETGRPVRDLGAVEIQQHSDIPWLGATLDRVTAVPGGEWPCTATTSNHREHQELVGCAAPLQIKSAIGSRHRWADGPPAAFDVQVQIEVACYGSSWGALAVRTTNGPLTTFDLASVDILQPAVLEELEDFRRRVRDRDPLPPAGPAALAAAKRLYHTAGNGETAMLGDSVQELVGKWEEAKHRSREADGEADQIEAELRFLLGDATWARLPGGGLLERKLRRVKAHTREASEGVVLSYRGGRR